MPALFRRGAGRRDRHTATSFRSTTSRRNGRGQPRNLRRLVGRGERSGLELRVDERFEEFYGLHAALHDRKRAPLYLPLDAFTGFYDELRDKGLARLYHAVTPQGRVAASPARPARPSRDAHRRGGDERGARGRRRGRLPPLEGLRAPRRRRLPRQRPDRRDAQPGHALQEPARRRARNRSGGRNCYATRPRAGRHGMRRAGCGIAGADRWDGSRARRRSAARSSRSASITSSPIRAPRSQSCSKGCARPGSAPRADERIADLLHGSRLRAGVGTRRGRGA